MEPLGLQSHFNDSYLSNTRNVARHVKRNVARHASVMYGVLYIRCTRTVGVKQGVTCAERGITCKSRFYSFLSKSVVYKLQVKGVNLLQIVKSYN